MKRSAFTLIELSIVLVIIGLIVGGVLVGQDLIRAAGLRSVITDLNKIDAAVNTFRFKYDCVAGDCANATNFFGTDATCPTTAANLTPKKATCNGNGDKKVGNAASTGSTDPTLWYEYWRFWQHLANAELIEGQYTGTQGTSASLEAIPGTNLLASKMNNVGYLYRFYQHSGSSGHFPLTPGHRVYVASPNPLTVSNGFLAGPAFSPLEAQSMDAKLDDGMPGTGIVHGSPDGSISAPDCSTTNDPATAEYDLSTDNKLCYLLYSY